MSVPGPGLDSLFGRTLVLAAHPDDEAACAGVLLQRMREPAVAFLTDGAPQSSYFWESYGSREQYAMTRRAEAHTALGVIGVEHVYFCQTIRDQELFRHLAEAQAWLDDIVEQLRPEALIAPAFEGGHPDHDSCNLLACVCGTRTGLPVWEVPLYHRSVDGKLVNQQFLAMNGTEVTLTPTPEEWDRKLRMFGEYASQREVLQGFLAQVEMVRPLAAYVYEAPPHPGVLNYEAWQWGMTGSEVARAFSTHLRDAIGKQTTAEERTVSH